MKLHKQSVSGVALIIVLGFLVIISALAVAFFSSVNTELKASRNFAAGVTTRQLADSAVQLVMGQISAATMRGVDVNGDGMGNEAWASQPGMIRVYGSNLGVGAGSTASNRADAFFKLYSSDKMILTGTDLAGFKTGQYSDPNGDSYANWDLAPALWTDLNAPVLVRDPISNQTTPRFPVIDPRAYTHSVTPATQYTDTKWQDTVEGFTYDSGSVHGAVGPGNANNQRLPMPVRWIYILQDGQLTTPVNTGTSTATFVNTAPSGTNVPTAQNPIVGRMAFWADDETCKLNLNTAAGFTKNMSSLGTAYQSSPSAFAGSFWDTPRFYTEFDYGIPDANGIPQPNKTSGGLALCQLLQNEFQRYPGHPATTSLAPVLNNLLSSEQLYALVPRYSNLNLQLQPSSTVGGTQRIIVDPVNTPGDLDNKQLQPKQDRLFASTDELLFGPHVKTGNFSSPGYARMTVNAYNSFPGNPITPELIDQLRFFVTTQSRAPELNLYGQPRVTCWPVRSETAAETTGLNVFDNLILFCSTVGASTGGGARPDTKNTASGVYRYIFTRRELATNGSMTSVTGHPDPTNPAVSQSQYEFNTGFIQDCELTRNKALLSSYLPNLMARAVPGVGRTYAQRNFTSQDQQAVLTEIFDYVRLANSQDTTTTISTGAAIQYAPRGYVVPSKPGTYFNAPQAKGFGRMSTLCEASLVFYYAGPQMDASYVPPAPASSYLTSASWSKWDPSAPNSRYVKFDPITNKVKGGYMRAFLLFSTFDPMQGYAPKTDPAQTDPKLSIEVRWPQDWSVSINGPGGGGGPMGWPVAGAQQGVATTVYRAPGAYWGGRNYGGYEGFMHTLQGSGVSWAPYKVKWDNVSASVASSFLTMNADYGETYNSASPSQPIKNSFVSNLPGSAYNSTTEEYYPFQTKASSAIAIPGPSVNSSPTFNFSGGSLIVLLYYGGSSTNNNSKALQTINMTFPAGQNWPVPQGPPAQLNPMTANQFKMPNADVTTWAAMDANPQWYGGAVTASNQGTGMHTWYWTGNGAFFANMATGLRTSKLSVFTYRTSLQASWSLATRIAWCTAPDTGSGLLGGGSSYDPYTNSSGTPVAPGYLGDRWRCIVQPGDTIRSLLYWNGKSASGGTLSGKQAISSGDLRLAAVTSTIQATDFAPHPDYTGPQSRACVLRGGDGNRYFPVTQLVSTSAPANVLMGGGDPRLEATLGNHISITGGASFPLRAVFPETRAFGNLPWSGGANPTAMVNGVVRGNGGGSAPGDFDNGAGDFPDGPFCNKQDEGNVIYRYLDYNGQYVYPIPYFTSNWSYQKPGNTFTSPSRQMPSPGMFGSLPSQVPENFGWQTLCFSPVPAGTGHPGNQDPKDHLLLDLFQMPVVEPYPISEPFSTAGKVNLNYRIAPFDYIRRSTALRGALYPLRVTVVDSQGASNVSNSSQFLTYKTGQLTAGFTPLNGPNGNPLPIPTNFRKELDRDLTIAGFDGFYDFYAGDPDNGFFKSASQVCERYFYPRNDISAYAGTPSGETSALQTYWAKSGDLTGDNEREKPYTDLYPRVTTKSNTFTVHMRVQTLRQAARGPGGNYATWVEGKDNVLGEYRGASTIERYIDPADPRFATGPSNAINPDQKSVEPLYRFRVVINKKFTP
ncbi:MAG: Verru_Chthon cassette protein A [Chthoniobacter sp.]|uniref:Verru_Chthon cassette protein A n=1 Tax=Chthoniobacter sp. TaxID=2510640 RepID=UPI0032A52A41